jgi:hypothetical protein
VSLRNIQQSSLESELHANQCFGSTMAAEFLRLQSNVCMYEVESNSFENKQGIIPDQIRSDQSIYKSPSESPDIFTRQQ